MIRWQPACDRPGITSWPASASGFSALRQEPRRILSGRRRCGPFSQIADHLYYVGSRDLTAYLITTSAGNILINANLASSPPQIRASVEQLGFKWLDTKILLNSQAHSDHMGGAAEILHETHAQDMVMDGDAEDLRSGARKDFAFGTDGILLYAPAPVDRVLHDGDLVSLSGVTLTAGHTRGCTTWTMRTHITGDAPGRLRDAIILGGMYPLWQHRFFDEPGRPAASYPGIREDFEHTPMRRLKRCPVTFFWARTGVYFDLLEKLKRMPREGEAVFIDPQGYREAIEDAKAAFAKTRAAARADAAKHSAS